MPEQLPTATDTEALGARLGRQLRAGDLVVLDGPLGAGKTVLARGIAAGLGVRGPITSPTFVIAREHAAGQRGIPLVHVDAYRLGAGGRPTGDTASSDLAGELDALDLDTDLAAAVVVVEWGAGVVEHLAERHLLVRLSRSPDTEVRTATVEWIRTAPE